MLSTKLKEAAGNSADATLYVDDVFSTYLYTGNGSTQTITNGIDLAGKGGLVWGKVRSTADNHMLMDSARGYNKNLSSNITNPQTTSTPAGISANSDGFSLTTSNGLNESDWTYASWTFRKAAKFFDVVTYTGTGSARTIAHSLGVAPGMVIVKRTDTTGDWQVYSNGLTSAAYSIQLNLTNAQASAPTVWNSTAPTSSVFSVGTDSTVNASGGTYVAYLYAHDTSSTGIIQCGSFTTPGQVNLGWEPQYLLYKKADGTSNWIVYDSMRGFGADTSNPLYPNLSVAEGTGDTVTANATGFNSPFSGSTYIYMAIRMPNKPPTSGTQVFSPNLSSSGTGTQITTGFPVDAQISKVTTGGNNQIYDRLRGVTSTTTQSAQYLVTNLTDTENTTTNDVRAWNNTGFQLASGLSGIPVVYWNFGRAPGFFDEVCYTGTGANTTQAHNLTVVPELMIVKERSAVNDWWVYVSSVGNTKYSVLNSTAVPVTSSTAWNNTTPTASVFSIGTATNVNASAQTFVAYLFATLAGIQYINSYVGDGTTGRVINCGFSAGARFICIKATSTTGSWWVWDSARGITSGNDPALQLNSTAAEITSADAIDPSSSGFIVNQEATCSINASGVSYLVWAIA